MPPQATPYDAIVIGTSRGGKFLSIAFAQAGQKVALIEQQMFRRFGSQVTLIERQPGLLAREDEDVCEAIAELFRQMGSRS